MKKTIVQITTAGTEHCAEKTFVLPGEDVPQLWAVELRIDAVDRRSGRHSMDRKSAQGTIYLEREVLEAHGLVGRRSASLMELDVAPTAEDLILQLLEHVGVFPEE